MYSSNSLSSIEQRQMFALDQFGRFRVSEPYTSFSSKLFCNDGEIFWDDRVMSGSTPAGLWQPNRASYSLKTSANTVGKFARQTFQWMSYQNAKSQLIFWTGANFKALPGNKKEIMYGNDDNGLGFRYHYTDEEMITLFVRSFTTGVSVDDDHPRNTWNIDKLNGQGASGIELEQANAQIMFADFEWLGTGTVAYGFILDGQPTYVHEVKHANNIDKVYMSSPNLPVRYSIENDGSGAADELEQICCAVISEGGQDETGTLFYLSTQATPLALGASTAGKVYAIGGMELKDGCVGAQVHPKVISMMSAGNDDFEWMLLMNPTYAVDPVLFDAPRTPTNMFVGTSINEITALGDVIDGGYAKSAVSERSVVDPRRRMGEALDGTRDQLVVAVRPLTNNSSFYAAGTFLDNS